MKIQLAKTINFIFSKDNDEELVVHPKTGNKEVINGKVDEVIKNFLNHFFTDIKMIWKNQ